MNTKSEILEKIDADYLKKVILGVNNVPRYDFLDMPHSEFMDYADRKFTKKQLHAIWGNYFLGMEPEEIVEQLRENDEHDLRRKFLQIINNDFIIKREVCVDRRRSDIVIFNKKNKSLYAVEIKSNKDKIERAKGQLKDAKCWANYIYLVVEKKYLEDAKKFPNSIGIFLINNNKCMEIRKSKKNNVLLETYLKLLPMYKLKKIAREYKIDYEKNDLIMREKFLEIAQKKKLLSDCKQLLIS